MPRFHVLTAGFKAPVTSSSVFSTQAQGPLSPQSPSTPGVQTPVSTSFFSSALSSIPSGFGFFSTQPSLASLGSQGGGNTQAEESQEETFQQKRDKRKSRLGTSEHLSQPVELAEDDNTRIFKEGVLSWSPAATIKGKKGGIDSYYFVIRNGELQRYVDLQQFEGGKRPIGSLNIANARAAVVDSSTSPNGKQLRVTLIEDEEMHIFESSEPNTLTAWKIQILRVAKTWGEVQKVQMEHEVAYLRKQLGALWELCSSGSEIPPKVQKRINDITADIQVKDALLGDMADRQDEFALAEMDQPTRRMSRRARQEPDDEVVELPPQITSTKKDVEIDSTSISKTMTACHSRETLDDRHSVLESTYILMEASGKKSNGSQDDMRSETAKSTPTWSHSTLEEKKTLTVPVTYIKQTSSDSLTDVSRFAQAPKIATQFATSSTTMMSPSPISAQTPGSATSINSSAPAPSSANRRRAATKSGSIAKQMEKELLLKGESNSSPRTQRKAEAEKLSHERQSSNKSVENPFKPSPFEAPVDFGATNEDGFPIAPDMSYQAYRRASRRSVIQLPPDSENMSESVSAKSSYANIPMIPEKSPARRSSKVNPFEAPPGAAITMDERGFPVASDMPILSTNIPLGRRSSRRSAVLLPSSDENIPEDLPEVAASISNVSQFSSDPIQPPPTPPKPKSSDSLANIPKPDVKIHAPEPMQTMIPVQHPPAVARRSSRRTAVILPLAEEEIQEPEPDKVESIPFMAADITETYEPASDESNESLKLTEQSVEPEVVQSDNDLLASSFHHKPVAIEVIQEEDEEKEEEEEEGVKNLSKPIEEETKGGLLAVASEEPRLSTSSQHREHVPEGRPSIFSQRRSTISRHHDSNNSIISEGRSSSVFAPRQSVTKPRQSAVGINLTSYLQSLQSTPTRDEEKKEDNSNEFKVEPVQKQTESSDELLAFVDFKEEETVEISDTIANKEDRPTTEAVQTSNSTETDSFATSVSINGGINSLVSRTTDTVLEESMSMKKVVVITRKQSSNSINSLVSPVAARHSIVPTVESKRISIVSVNPNDVQVITQVDQRKSVIITSLETNGQTTAYTEQLDESTVSIKKSESFSKRASGLISNTALKQSGLTKAVSGESLNSSESLSASQPIVVKVPRSSIPPPPPANKRSSKLITLVNPDNSLNSPRRISAIVTNAVVSQYSRAELMSKEPDPMEVLSNTAETRDMGSLTAPVNDVATAQGNQTQSSAPQEQLHREGRKLTGDNIPTTPQGSIDPPHQNEELVYNDRASTRKESVSSVVPSISSELNKMGDTPRRLSSVTDKVSVKKPLLELKGLYSASKAAGSSPVHLFSSPVQTPISLKAPTLLPLPETMNSHDKQTETSVDTVRSPIPTAPQPNGQVPKEDLIEPVQSSGSFSRESQITNTIVSSSIAQKTEVSVLEDSVEETTNLAPEKMQLIENHIAEIQPRSEANSVVFAATVTKDENDIAGKHPQVEENPVVPVAATRKDELEIAEKQLQGEANHSELEAAVTNEENPLFLESVESSHADVSQQASESTAADSLILVEQSAHVVEVEATCDKDTVVDHGNSSEAIEANPIVEDNSNVTKEPIDTGISNLNDFPGSNEVSLTLTSSDPLKSEVAQEGKEVLSNSASQSSTPESENTKLDDDSSKVMESPMTTRESNLQESPEIAPLPALSAPPRPISVPPPPVLPVNIPLPIHPPIRPPAPPQFLPTGFTNLPVPQAPTLAISLPVNGIPVPPRPVAVPAPPIPPTLPRPPVLPQSIPLPPPSMISAPPLLPQGTIPLPPAPILRPGLAVPVPPPPTLPKAPVLPAAPVLPPAPMLPAGIKPPPVLPSSIQLPPRPPIRPPVLPTHITQPPK